MRHESDIYLPIKVGSPIIDWDGNFGRVVARQQTGYGSYLYDCTFEGEDFDPNSIYVRGCSEIMAMPEDYVDLLEFDHQ